MGGLKVPLRLPKNTHKKGNNKNYCPNSKNCLSQIIVKFEHFISRKAMNIDSLGSETIELLIKEKLLVNISDLYWGDQIFFSL